jgi:hypothetical protein
VPSVSVAALVMSRIAAKGRRRARVLAALPAAGVHALTMRSSGTGLQRASPASSQPLSYDVRAPVHLAYSQGLRSCYRPHSKPSSQALVASREASYPSLRLPGVRHRRAG